MGDWVRRATLAAVTMLLLGVYAPSASAVPSDDPANVPRLIGGEVIVLQMDADDHDQPSAGKTRDSTPAARHGTLSNVQQAAGAFGNGYDFMGSNSNIAIPDAPTSGLNAGTAMAWVKPANGGPILLKIRPGSSTELSLHAFGNGHVSLMTGQSRGSTILSTEGVITRDAWQHVAFSWGAEGKRIYVNGIEVASNGDTAGVGTISTVTHLGRDPNSCCNVFDGFIDEFRIYNRTLNVDEINDVMVAPYDGIDTPTVSGDDLDGDGLINSHETALGTRLRHHDSDLDGLSDYQEAIVYGSDPLDADSDDDGLNDFKEILELGTAHDATDSDADGLLDAADPTPTRESIAPNYSAPWTSSLVISEAGYIDVAVNELQQENGAPSADQDAAVVLLTGRIMASNASGPIPWPLWFSTEAERLDGGLWGARFALPPGITSTSEIKLRLLVSDEEGNTWWRIQTFDHSIHSPEWTENLNASAQSAGWDHLMEQVAPPMTGAGEGATVAGVLGGFPVAEEVWAYAFDPAADAFVPTSLNLIPIGNMIRPPQIDVAGFATHWNGLVNDALDVGRAGLTEAYHQTGSFVAGGNSGWADGRKAGDFVSTFLFWGDIRDCTIGILPMTNDGADAAITGLSCAGVAIDVAQFTGFGTAPAAAANAVTATLKISMKTIKSEAPEFVAHMGNLAVLCYKEGRLCKEVGEIASFVAKNPTAGKHLARVVDSIGGEEFLKLVAKNPKVLERVTRMSDEMSVHLGEAQARATLTSLHRAPNLGGTSADKFDRMTKLHAVYRENGLVTPQESAAFMQDVAKLVDSPSSVSGVSDWVKKATGQANDKDATSWTGFLFDAKRFREDIDAGRLVSVSKKMPMTDVPGYGRVANIDADAIVTTPNGKRWVEHKSASVLDTGDNRKQFTQHVYAMKKWKTQEGFGTELHWRVGGTVDPAFKTWAQELATSQGLTVEFIEGMGAAVV